jgi:hypothetical protein
MSAITTPVTLAETEPRPVRIPSLAALAWAGHTAMLLGLALLVPGEAERIASRIAPPPRRPRR